MESSKTVVRARLVVPEQSSPPVDEREVFVRAPKDLAFEEYKKALRHVIKGRKEATAVRPYLV